MYEKRFNKAMLYNYSLRLRSTIEQNERYGKESSKEEVSDFLFSAIWDKLVMTIPSQTKEYVTPTLSGLKMPFS